MLENRAFQRCFGWWRGAGRKREGKRISERCCDFATVEYSPHPFSLPSRFFPFSYKSYLPLEWFWGLVIADFSFLFLFFLGNGWEGRRINYNLPSEKTSFAWTNANIFTSQRWLLQGKMCRSTWNIIPSIQRRTDLKILFAKSIYNDRKGGFGFPFVYLKKIHSLD